VTADGAVETIRFSVRGMTCSSCVGRIMRSVGKVPGVAKVSVDLRHETATVQREPALASNTAIAAAVSLAGYVADVDAAVVVPPRPSRSVLKRLLGSP
jgi:P-type Cu+ transporter